MRRKLFINGEIYHIFNKSIANFNIFKDPNNCDRFLKILDYYNNPDPKISLSKQIFLKKEYDFKNILIPKEKSIIKYISYCIMPDHYHLLIKVLDQAKIYQYLNNIGNSYTHFFNTKFERLGPLWQSGYKMVRVKNNEQLLHLSRYINLNPTTAGLVDKSEDWIFSSYRDLITEKLFLNELIKEISISNPETYQKFVENNKDYQKKLKMIKKLKID